MTEHRQRPHGHRHVHTPAHPPAASPRATRSRRVAVALCAVAVGSTALSCALVDRGEESVVEAFATAWSAGDLDGAARLTDAPEAALAVLTEVRGDTVEVNPTVSATTLPTEEDPSFTLSVAWDFGGDRRWSYDATGQVSSGDAPVVRWDPSVLQPDLELGESLVFDEVPPAPSAVLGSTGEPLLTQQELLGVAVDPSTTDDPAATAAQVADLLSSFDDSITPDGVLAEMTAAGDGTAAIARLRPADADQVRTALEATPGVELTTQLDLLTTDRALSSPALSGLEPAWEQAQTSAAGWRMLTVDDAGAIQRELVDIEPGTSEDLVSTLSRPVQLAAQDAVDSRTEQTVLVAIQPSTGAVLAVAQNEAAAAEGPLALTGLYPPGSTFKIVTTAAALGAGAAAPDTVLPCPGTENIEGRQIRNDDSFDLGAVPLHTAFAQSCNTTLARLAVGLPETALRDTALSLGLGVTWDIPGLTAVTGNVPPAQTPTQRVEWSIGQGEVLASPFGMATVTASVAAGRAVAPSILAGQPGTPDTAPPPLPAGTSSTLLNMMRETVTSGSARALDDIDSVGGKTGTAQYGDGTGSHGWFVAVQGDLALAVLVVGGQSSGPAVQTAGQFLRTLDR